jgi:hypothetical protein
MTLDKLRNIARLLDGIDLEGGDAALLNQLQPRKKELLEYCSEKDFVKSFMALYIEFGQELASIYEPDAPAKEGKPLSVYEMVMSYYFNLIKIGFKPTEHTLKDAKMLLRINNRLNTIQNLYNLRAHLNTSDKVAFNVDMETLEKNNFEDTDLINILIDKTETIIRGYNG